MPFCPAANQYQSKPQSIKTQLLNAGYCNFFALLGTGAGLGYFSAAALEAVNPMIGLYTGLGVGFTLYLAVVYLLSNRSCLNRKRPQSNSGYQAVDRQDAPESPDDIELADARIGAASSKYEGKRVRLAS